MYNKPFCNKRTKTKKDPKQRGTRGAGCFRPNLFFCGTLVVVVDVTTTKATTTTTTTLLSDRKSTYHHHQTTTATTGLQH
jgi:hypothetical protein